MSSAKTFLLLPHRIPANEPLLGLTTTNPISPLTSSTVPSDNKNAALAAVITPSSTLTTTEFPGTLEISVSSSLSFSLSLEPFVTVETSSSNNKTYTITSHLIRKTRLKDPQALFAKLLENAELKQSFIQLLRKREPGSLRHSKAFFITGIITATDARIFKSDGKTIGFDAQALVPVDLIVGVPLPIDIGPSIGGGGSSGGSTSTSSRSVGEEIWGVEYMEVRKKAWGTDVNGLGRPVEKVKGGRFFGKDEEDDESSEEEDDDDEISFVLWNGEEALKSTKQVSDFVAISNV